MTHSTAVRLAGLTFALLTVFATVPADAADYDVRTSATMASNSPPPPPPPVHRPAVVAAVRG